MIKSSPTELCVFTFYWIAFVVIFQTKLVSFESEFGSIRYLRKRKGFSESRIPVSGPVHRVLLPGKSVASPVHRVLLPEIPVASPVHRVLLPDCQKKPKPGDSGSQPGTPGAATGKVGIQPGTPGLLPGSPVASPVLPGQLPVWSTLPQTTSFLSPTFPQRLYLLLHYK